MLAFLSNVLVLRSHDLVNRAPAFHPVAKPVETSLHSIRSPWTCNLPQFPAVAADASEFPPQPTWQVPQTTARPEIFIVDGLSLLEHVMRALGPTLSSQSLSENPRLVHAFSFILTDLLTAHVTDDSAFTIVFPKTSAETISSPITRLTATAARLCTSVGLHVYFAKGRMGDVIATLTRLSIRSAVDVIIVTAAFPTPLLQLLHWPSARLLLMSRTGIFSLVSSSELTGVLGLSPQFSVSPHNIPDILALASHIAPADSRARKDLVGLIRTAVLLLNCFRSLHHIIQAARLLLSAHPRSSDCPTLTKRLARRIVANEADIGRNQRVLYLSNDVPLGHLSWQMLQRASVDIEDLARISSTFHLSHNNLLNRPVCAVKRKEESVPVASASRNTSNYFSTKSVHSHDFGRTHPVSSGCGGPGDRLYAVKETPSYVDAPFPHNVGIVGLFPLFQKADSERSHLSALVISVRPGAALLVPIGKEPSVPENLKRMLVNERVAKHGWFLKDTYKALLTQCNIRLEGPFFDNHVATHLLFAGESVTDSYIISKYLPDDEVTQSVLNHSKDPPIMLTPHPMRALLLCDVSLRLSHRLKAAISDAGLSTIMDTVEGPMVPVLGDMELTGVPIDFQLLRTAHDRLRQHRIELRRKLKSILRISSSRGNSPLQLSSAKDIQTFLSPVLGATGIDADGCNWTEDSATNFSTLSKIALNGAVPSKYRQFASLFVQFREVSTVVRVHTTGLLENVCLNGRVHPKFSQTAAASGRISTSRPNLQALPLRSAVSSPSLRQLVKAGRGRCIICADYCQIELRIAAAMSRDPNLLLSVEGDKDVHKDIASRLYGVANINDVTASQRAAAKRVVYSILYGVSAMGLSKELNMARRDAELLIFQFFKCYPELERFTKRMVDDAISSGRAQTLLGRQQRLPRLVNGTEKERRSAQRVAMNMPIQGTQADMLKLAMGGVSRRLREMHSRSALIMQLHDELLLEVDDGEKETIIKMVTDEMQRALPLQHVDIVVKIGQGSTWLAASNSATICSKEVEHTT